MCGCKTKLFEISPQRDVQLVKLAVEIENHLTRQGRTNFGGINLILKALLDRFLYRGGTRYRALAAR